MSVLDRDSFVRRFLMFVVIPLLLIAGVQLFVLSSRTDAFFAWTIKPPLTAAYLGAGYWAALCAAYAGLQETAWRSARTSLPAAWTATTMLGIATFVHLDKFHLASPLFITRFVTWVWIVVYAVTPPIFLVLLISQLRQWSGGRMREGRAAWPGWRRVSFLPIAGLSLLAGLLLFFAPSVMIPAWPWALTPLTARAVGAWLATFGVASAAIYLENDQRTATGTILSLLAFCALELIVVARYFSTVDWTKPLAWIYLAFLVGTSLVSLAAWRASRQHTA